MSSPLPNRPVTATAGVITSAAGPLEEAELCTSLAEFHGLQGRMAIGIVLRQYLDPLVLTPTEILYNHKQLRALLNKTQLVENAIVRVSMVQARLPGQDQRSRRTFLQKAIDDTAARARAAQIVFGGLPKGRSAIDSVLSAPPGKTPTGDAAYDFRVALAEELVELRTWPAKLDRLIQLVQAERDERLSAAVDGAIADVLGSLAATQDLFGAHLPPGGVLLKLCETVFGRVVQDGMGPNRPGVLNALFRQGRLPMARAAVLERIRRQLCAPQPLGRGPADQEAELLRALLGQLVTPTGVIGGGAMADALTIRYARRLEQGGATAYRRSIVGLSEVLADLVCRVHYLTAVSAVPAAERHMGEIVDALDAALNNELLVENMVLQTPDVALVTRAIAAAASALRVSPLPDEAKARIAGRVEGVVDEFARQGRLVARLRRVEPVLRRRTIRLAELACSGLVREDGALPLLRQHIMEVVRQPQFQADLLAQPNSDLAQAEIRRLYELLDRLRQTSSLAAPKAPLAPALRPEVGLAPAGPAAEPAAEEPPAVRTMAIDPAPRPAAPAILEAGDGRCPCCFAPRTAREACRACGYPDQIDNRNGVHLMPGTVLFNRYKVGRILGQGGFGATYLGWDDRLQVKVAVKEFYPANLISRIPGSLSVIPFSDEHARGFTAGLAKFLDEARLLARLRDVKEIVRIQDFFEENDTAYLVMELLEGRTMKKYVLENGGRIDARRALAVLSPIMKALQSVHEQGLVHRDISPDNIFLTSGGERKLLDFGAARHASGASAGLTVILKPGYAPPEQYSQEGRQGPWTDVYALCATIHWALTGKTPPDATTRLMNDRVPKLSDAGVTVPPAFEKVLLAGLSMRWQERPQSVRDLLKAMNGTLRTG